MTTNTDDRQDKVSNLNMVRDITDGIINLLEDASQVDEPEDNPYCKTDKEQREAEKKKRQKELLWIHRLWRIINWTIIIWLANSAFKKVISWIDLRNVGASKFAFFLVTFVIAAVMIIYAEGTDHDKARTRIAWTMTGISMAVLSLPVVARLLLEIINILPGLFGWQIFNTRSLAPTIMWWIQAIMATAVVISVLREEQSTDKNLGFARTPQKKKYKDINMNATNDDGEPVIQIRDYNK